MELSKIAAYETLFPTGAIIDGVVDGETYLTSNPKIAWFLKEAYTDEPDGWHIKKYYAQEDAYENFFKNSAKQTWHPIIYASYGILNGFKEWEDVPYIRDQPKMCDIIKNIAIINANKLPSETGTYTLWENLDNGFNKFRNLILKQLEVLEPDIHIFGSTFHLYKELFGINNDHKVTVQSDFQNCNVWIKDGKLFLDVYHPASRFSKTKYVNQIVKAAKFWKYNG